jgi:cargo-transport protein YPP1
MTNPVRESEKALRYISQLDSARCQGAWEQVPELARKVEKHAPHRKSNPIPTLLFYQFNSVESCANCPQVLVLAARSEATVASVEASSPFETSALPSLIVPLLNAINSDQPHGDDKFQATICVGWIHWVSGEPQLAAARLPKDAAEALEDASGEGCLSSQWVQVCASKCAYIKGKLALMGCEHSGSCKYAFRILPGEDRRVS